MVSTSDVAGNDVTVINQGAITVTGITDGNLADNNPRPTNEDRALIGSGPVLAEQEAISYVKDVVANKVRKATDGIWEGSTLTWAMRLNSPPDDPKYLLTTIGDSPAYAVLRNTKKREVKLVSLVPPHNNLRDLLIGSKGEGPITETWDALKEQGLRDKADYLDILKNPDGGWSSMARTLTRFLGKGGNNKVEPDAHTPEVRTFSPKALFNDPNWQYEGLLICSDGVENAVDAGAVQKALADTHPSEYAVQAVSTTRDFPEKKKDNVTALFMPANAKVGEYAIVADGNTDRPVVSQAIVDTMAPLLVGLQETVGRATDLTEGVAPSASRAVADPRLIKNIVKVAGMKNASGQGASWESKHVDVDGKPVQVIRINVPEGDLRKPGTENERMSSSELLEILASQVQASEHFSVVRTGVGKRSKEAAGRYDIFKTKEGYSMVIRAFGDAAQESIQALHNELKAKLSLNERNWVAKTTDVYRPNQSPAL